MRKRRILYYCDSTDWGGAEVYLQHLLGRMAGENIEIYLAVPRGDAHEQFSRCFAQCRVSVRPYDASRESLIETLWLTWSLMREFKPDLVHFALTGFTSCRYGIWVFRWLWKIPSVVTIQLLSRSSLGRWRFGRTALRNHVTRRAIRGFRKIIVVSGDMKKQLADEFGVEPCAPVEVIRNAVDTELFACDCELKSTERYQWGLSNTDFVIVMVARLDEQQKAQTAALAALTQVPTVPRRSVLLLIGDGPSKGMLEARVSALGITDRVIFMGRLSDIRPPLHMADVAILPSRNEGLPFALLEAMAIGLPVVASRIAGIPEVVEDGVSGLLIDPGDSHQLAAQLCLLYQDDQLRVTLGRAARETVHTKCSLSGMVAATLKAYELGL